MTQDKINEIHWYIARSIADIAHKCNVKNDEVEKEMINYLKNIEYYL